MANKSQRPATRHHVVSKFYLAYFADDAGRVTTVRLPGDASFPQSIENASVHNDFYTAIGHDGRPTDVAEKAFSLIEAPAATAWREIVAGHWPLTDESRLAVAAWVALQLLRGSALRQSMNDTGTDLLQLHVMVGGRTQLRDFLKQLGEPYDPESVDREWVSWFEDPPVVDIQANHHLQHLAAMLPRVTRSLLERRWILTTFQRKALATSDHPVYVVPNPEDLKIGLGTGIENAAAIEVPLTRRHGLSLALPSTVPWMSADVRQPGATVTALYSNSCAARSARRMIFHHPDDSPLQGIDLSAPRTREVGQSGDPWRFMSAEDRQVLIDAGVRPPDPVDPT